MSIDTAWLAEIRAELAAAGNPEQAAQQQAYMKSAMPFYGLRMPQLRMLIRALVASRPVVGRSEWEETLRLLWDEAKHREERYAVLVLLRHRWSKPHLDCEALALIGYFVETGAWWDLVDELAHVVEAILVADPARAEPTIKAWSISEDMWLRRASVLSQLTRKGATNLTLLEECVAANLAGSRFGDEFFIRKAIGWALRHYARTDSAWVRDFLARYEARLSPLSRREAAKHMQR